jgi:dTDP-4-amino-4,6-dideoxygalactose transaminase
MAFTADHNFLHKKLAYNFRMTAMQAAVATAQVERLDEILATRKQIEQRYDEGLQSIAGVTLMPPRDVLWMYDVRAENSAALREFLAVQGIETRVFFKPMSRQPGYLDPVWPSLNASRLAEDGFYLPTHTQLTAADQDFIVGKVREFYAVGGRA